MWPIPSQAQKKGRHSTQLTFTDGWSPLCSNCSSIHNWSRTGDTPKLYSFFTSCQGTPDYSLSWWLVLHGTLWGSLSQARHTWGQAAVGQTRTNNSRTMDHQMNALLVPSASDVLLRFAGGQLNCAALFELVSSMSPVDPEGLSSWRGT